MTYTPEPTGCSNPGCEYRQICYRAVLHDSNHHVTAYFTRDQALAKSRGFDCYWELPKGKKDG